MRKGRGEIKRVSDLFEKYRKTLIAPQKTVIGAFVEVVDDVLGIKLKPESVRYAPGSKECADDDFIRKTPRDTRRFLIIFILIVFFIGFNVGVFDRIFQSTKLCGTPRSYTVLPQTILRVVPGISRIRTARIVLVYIMEYRVSVAKKRTHDTVDIGGVGFNEALCKRC